LGFFHSPRGFASQLLCAICTLLAQNRNGFLYELDGFEKTVDVLSILGHITFFHGTKTEMNHHGWTSEEIKLNGID